MHPRHEHALKVLERMKDNKDVDKLLVESGVVDLVFFFEAWVRKIVATTPVSRLAESMIGMIIAGYLIRLEEEKYATSQTPVARA